MQLYSILGIISTNDPWQRIMIASKCDQAKIFWILSTLQTLACFSDLFSSAYTRSKDKRLLSFVVIIRSLYLLIKLLFNFAFISLLWLAFSLFNNIFLRFILVLSSSCSSHSKFTDSIFYLLLGHILYCSRFTPNTVLRWSITPGRVMGQHGWQGLNLGSLHAKQMSYSFSPNSWLVFCYILNMYTQSFC